MQRLLLFLSATRLHAQLMQHGHISSEHEFADTSEGQKSFSLFLRTAKYPTYMLVDLIEEDFRQETVPHLTGKARSALLWRKFEQFFRSTPFHQATLLRRQKNGRRDDDMLFSALTNPQLVRPWLDMLLAQQMPLAGIYSVPQISAPLVRDHPSDHLLLISWEKYSGLRQTYFSHHRLNISRLTPVHEEVSFQQAVQEELSRTYQYLKSLGLLPPGQVLDVRLLGHSQDFSRLKLPENADMRYDFSDLEVLARQLHIDYHFCDSDASQIFLHQLAASPPQCHYASAEHTHYHRLWQYQRTLNLASGLLLSVFVSWGAYMFWQSQSKMAEAAQLAQQARHTMVEVNKISQAFQTHLASAADMKAGVSVMKLHHPDDSMPKHMLYKISTILDRYPQMELDSLSWQSDPLAGHEVYAQFTLKGRLVDFANNYRAALGYLDAFVRDMTAIAYQVEVLTKPFDASPGGSISDQREANALGFALKISSRAAP